MFREASNIDFVHEKRHMAFFWKLPFPLETSRTFFDSVKAPEALLFILQDLRLSVVYKSIIVRLGQGQDLIMSRKIYLKYKCTFP